MKKIITICAALLMTVGMFAQVPEKMSYQAVLRDESTNLITSTSVGMQLSILQGSATGIVVYFETQTPTTNANGLVSIEIGTGTTSDDFSTIDWANGPYFIKTETDPAGGTNYTITGISQLLSVPYALHSKTAESVKGGITETDPIFSSSQAANITTSDITNLGNLSGTNTGDQDLSGLASETALGDSTAQIRSEIPDVMQLATNLALTTGLEAKVDKEEGKGMISDGTSPGEMKFWNGTAWVNVLPGISGQVLTFSNGVPAWTSTIGWNDVTNPATGKTWMDRNLGASQVATSSTDETAYGDLYQWGRGSDGHEKRTSDTTSVLSNSNSPGHGNFITNNSSPWDWNSPQNDNLWQGVNGANNPCPGGYRLPTEAEWIAERASWSSNNSAGAFASPLKLPAAGFRDLIGDAPILNVGSHGLYWSSTVDGTFSRGLSISSAFMLSRSRTLGFSVRCLKD